MKLVEIVAGVVVAWPNRVASIAQGSNGDLYPAGGRVHSEFIWRQAPVADDWATAEVTRAQWEAERARILAESQPERDPEIAEIVEKAYGKRSKEDQALWDKVAIAALSGFFSRVPHIDRVTATEEAFAAADWFVAERAKRMK